MGRYYTLLETVKFEDRTASNTYYLRVWKREKRVGDNSQLQHDRWVLVFCNSRGFYQEEEFRKLSLLTRRADQILGYWQRRLTPKTTSSMRPA